MFFLQRLYDFFGWTGCMIFFERLRDFACGEVARFLCVERLLDF